MARQNREQQILDAAIQVFSSKGYGSATTAEIAAAAGVAEGTVFRYFKTKKDLLFRVFGVFADIFGENVLIKPLEDIFKRDDLPVGEVIKLAVKDRLPLIDKHFEMLLVVVGEVRFHPEIRDILLEKVSGRVMPMAAGYVKRAMERGLLRENPPEMVARVLIGNILFFVIQRKAMPMFGGAADTLEQELDLMVDIVLNGIAQKEDER